jgi:2-methylisocitrate lyase-like PEP mutase family enzyme
MTGAGTAASLFGKPDLGLVTMTEVVAAARNIADAVDIPLICDADTGYGDVLNVWHASRQLLRAGVAAIHLEDQSGSKKSGGLSGRTVLPTEAMIAKIRAAKDAVGDDLLIIARTDARYLGVEEAIDRLGRYLDAGAELALVAEYYGPAELRRLMAAVRPLALTHTNVPLSVQEHSELGTKVVLYPVVGLTVAARAIRDAYGLLLRTGALSPQYLEEHAISKDELLQVMGLLEWTTRERRFRNSS